MFKNHTDLTFHPIRKLNKNTSFLQKLYLYPYFFSNILRNGIFIYQNIDGFA